jgi:hypothetical protein
VAHRLLDDVLKANYEPAFTEHISFIKIDTEGFDADIVETLKSLPVRPVVQVEWFDGYRKQQCSAGTKHLFAAAASIDYDVYVWNSDDSC